MADMFPRKQFHVWGLIIGAMLVIGLVNVLFATCIAKPPVIGPGEAIVPVLPPVVAQPASAPK